MRHSALVKGLLLLDVIEHIEKDADFLRSLIAAIPRRLLSKTTLVESGLQPLRMRYYLSSRALFINTIVRPRAINVAAPTRPPLHRAMTAFVAVENALVGPARFIPGLLFASGRPTKNGQI